MQILPQFILFRSVQIAYIAKRICQNAYVHTYLAHLFAEKFATVKKLLYLCIRFFAGYSSARLECLLWEQEVVSSNLAIPTGY